MLKSALSRLPKSLLFALPLVLVAMAYWGVLSCDYVWDDRPAYADNPFVRQAGDFFAAVLRPALPGTSYFRPLVLASFILEFRAFGAQPWISHAVSLALHLFNTFMLAWVVASVVRDEQRYKCAALAALVYGLHPAMIEPVAWVSGRFDLMVVSFTLMMCWAGLNLSGWRRNLSAGLLYLCACFCKEMAALAPLILFALIGLQERHPFSLRAWWAVLKDQRRLLLWLSLLLAGVLYLALRVRFIEGVMHVDSELTSALTSLGSRAGFVGATLLFYVKLIVFPFLQISPLHPLEAAAGRPVVPVAEGLAALGALLALAIWLVRRRSRWAWFLVAWVAAMLPVANIIPLTIFGNIGHERFLALPMTIVALWVATLARPLFAAPATTIARTAAYMAAGIWGGAALLTAWATVPKWQSDYSLWSWVYKTHADRPFVQLNLLNAAVMAGDLETARQVIARVGETRNLSIRLLTGVVAVRSGEFERGIALLDDVMASQPLPVGGADQRSGGGSAQAMPLGLRDQYAWWVTQGYGARAEAHLELGRYAQALSDLDWVRRYAPDYAPGYLLASVALYGLDRLDDGDRAYQQAEQFYFVEKRADVDRFRVQAVVRLCSASTGRPDTVCRAFASRFPEQFKGMSR
ncbi:tetratricopeptide repeat protein [Niveibacterium umoris]|uniref:Glycosyltransferase RgtA/B/C/D-like domain-containing protein n=1 Tax=Niveibacterium umoris TaxID=1193620 RepID=A0A840BQL1_9RHOO|nr:hypothetical protein [Niveibacterium umoris]MBB4012707.1 hypothetical protein [Niveibacterium umoris]